MNTIQMNAIQGVKDKMEIKMNIQEFKKQCKELITKHGFNKSEISITTDYNWIRIRIKCNNIQRKLIYSVITSQIEKLAGFKNNSDISIDYFECSTTVANKWGGTYSGINIFATLTE